MPNVNSALGKYSELGISCLEINSPQSPASSFGSDVGRAVSLLSKFNNAVFIAESRNESIIIAETINKFCRDTSGKILREVFQIDTKQFIEASGRHPEIRPEEILAVLENEKEKILLVITSLEELTKKGHPAKLLQNFVKKSPLPILGMTTIAGFRQLEKNPRLAGYLQFILSEKSSRINKRDKSVLIIGATSLFGNTVYQLFSREYKVAKGTGFSKASSFGFDKLDVTSEEEIKKYFSGHPKYDIIVYIAGEADADAAEKERNRAQALNVNAVSIIARYVKDCKFVYISSEYVFDGKSGPYGSDSPACPINYYGQTKLEGEKAASKNFPDALVLRLGALYGYNGPGDKKTSVSKLIAGLEMAEPLKADNIQIKHPVLLEDAARTLLKLLDYETNGIYQTNGAEGLNKKEMAEQIAAVRNELTGNIFSYPITGIEQAGAAAKPFDTHMVNVDTPRLFSEGIRFIFLKQKTLKGDN